ncbi:MAG: hypothetical protein A2600_05955 [Candidatus Lambdaproteobacteria bacterium RIFOXYD1_FULL_56_27]|uniref:Diguanylate cyclase n=1 Tax=Candidatus Lambdaproteobacteria bacterium RIFOXYD2_FULL_56_26 TaxID=1817773 RepID=A0A1F6GMD1_9PROT|nr:MAG: hypothetical protein A2557_10080 [Candidatus Lambdaproteobacteria bacterium RIFOXYD2_FULL_56_26]OGH01798.1 MAG: hypothetical protein A2426_13990 [Candidatus Lambdaproteobacteria bacterium RIFOXYC1_FULL_56_13]OGH07646.1 MAG: hypothetical protein A2600_05955 [Candidatus Lambdaproteobacteria bacterium RIFOXYD1_FULL_56_27]
MPQAWVNRLKSLSFAYQPIVHIHSGDLLGVEALLLEVEQVGYGGPQEFFEVLREERCCAQAELFLLEKALSGFARLPNVQNYKLFFNLDPQNLGELKTLGENLVPVLSNLGLTREQVCFELSERHLGMGYLQAGAWLDRLQSQGFDLLLDHFGTGLAGLKLLYHSHPQFLKIDRSFLFGVLDNPKKKLFLTKMVNLAHLMETKVILQGVETEAEYFACREMGVDFVQGLLIGRPTDRIDSLQPKSLSILELWGKDRRKAKGDSKWLLAQLETIPPVTAHSSMIYVLDQFRKFRDHSSFPVVNDQGEPLGLICEEDLKQYVYSPFGRELMQNRSAGLTLANFLQPCPQADLNTPVEEVLEIYAQSDSAKGILITEQGNYLGFLSSNRLLKLLYERNLANARDQNPLTGLPGNHRISRFVQAACAGATKHLVLVYFDFDHFKPFNDKQGFRAGDRAILLFSELIQKQLGPTTALLGHIGGDDFFAAFSNTDFLTAQAQVSSVCQSFKRDVESFYSPEDRERGYIEAVSREGDLRRFPLLGVSAAVLEVKEGTTGLTLERISAGTAALKKGAKASPTGLLAAGLWR